jgi:hypothetical protein
MSTNEMKTNKTNQMKTISKKRQEAIDEYNTIQAIRFTPEENTFLTKANNRQSEAYNAHSKANNRKKLDQDFINKTKVHYRRSNKKVVVWEMEEILDEWG